MNKQQEKEEINHEQGPGLIGATGAAAPVHFEEIMHAPVIFQILHFQKCPKNVGICTRQLKSSTRTQTNAEKLLFWVNFKACSCDFLKKEG